MLTVWRGVFITECKMLYRVWNEDRTRCFVTQHLTVAQAICDGEEPINVSPLGVEFAAICTEEECTIESVESVG